MTLSDIHAGTAGLRATRFTAATKAIWTALFSKDIEAGHLSREDADTALFWLITTVALCGLALVAIIVFSVAQVALA